MHNIFAKENLIAYLYIPLSIIYLEVLVFVMAGGIFNFGNFIAMLFVSLAAGTLFSLLSSLSKSQILNGWIALIIMELICIIFMLTFFVQDTYRNYVNIATVVNGAGGIMKEFGSTILNILSHNLPRILLFEFPVLLFLLLGIILKKIRFTKNANKKAYGYLIILFLVLEGLGIGLSVRNQNNRIKLIAEYDFNTVVRCFNIQTGLKLDLCYLLLGNPLGCDFIEQDDALLFVQNETETNGVKYGENRMDVTLPAPQTQTENARKIYDYTNSLTPSSKNQYTGLFEGKNLIFISVESMSKEMISEELTPTLYHMQQTGINFEDYYQPYFNGSTSTGEFANILGLIPAKAMESYESTKGKNLYFTIGNELMRKNYFSRAYHNGTVEFYDRYIVHPNFGYEKFIANGNGMEEGLSGDWPESDLEMMEYALPQFIGESPFSTYFMTLSGHFPYFYDLSCMVEKYGDRTKNLGASSFVDAYLCAQIDFEEAIKYLVTELEKAGLLEDTVFVLAPDHYPYGLTKNDAWATDRNYLPELFGFEPEDMMDRDHNALIIWSPVLEEMEPVRVSEPSYSVDILPTLLNLFGLEFDSRLLAGRDVLSGTKGLVIWPDYSFRTSEGTYYALTNKYVSADGTEVDPDWLREMRMLVRNKMTLSKNILEENYYDLLFGDADSK